MILIAGEGLSGTTMFLHFLEKLGWDKGGHDEWCKRNDLDTVTDDFPEVIKHGGFCTRLDIWIRRFDWKVDHVFYPTCGIELGVEKRIFKEERGADPNNARFVGSTHQRWKQLSKDLKKKELRRQLMLLMASFVDQAFLSGVDFTFVNYPRFCLDKEYAVKCLQPILHLKGLTEEDVIRVHEELIDYNKLKDYREK